jgi:hypothetical protein
MANSLNRDQLASRLLAFTQQAVEQFLTLHPSLTFYAFAYDCNAEYAEVNLCFNTEEDFQQTLTHYQSGNYAQYYQSEQQIDELKYNTGDWQYQCFDTLYVLSEAELSEIYGDNLERQISELMTLFSQVLLDFSKTELFEKITKTENFRFICIDHDEELADAELRIIALSKEIDD